MPIPKSEAAMESHGWYRELTIPKIVIRDGVVYCQEYDFFADRLPCRIRVGGDTGPQCGTDHTWVHNEKGHLIWCCFKHKQAQGPLTVDVGHKASEYTVSAQEAIKILNKTGQRPPKKLEGLVADERAKVRIKRRPRKSLAMKK